MGRDTDIYEAITKDKLISNETEGVPEVLPFIKRWWRNSRYLRTAQISLGLLATFFSILTTTMTGVKGFEDITRAFAFIAAVSIGLITAFNLDTKSNNMTNAWRQLVGAVMKFNTRLCDRQVVIKTWEESQKLIGDVWYQQPGGALPANSGQKLGEPRTNSGH